MASPLLVCLGILLLASAAFSCDGHRGQHSNAHIIYVIGAPGNGGTGTPGNNGNGNGTPGNNGGGENTNSNGSSNLEEDFEDPWILFRRKREDQPNGSEKNETPLIGHETYSGVQIKGKSKVELGDTSNSGKPKVKGGSNAEAGLKAESSGSGGMVNKVLTKVGGKAKSDIHEVESVGKSALSSFKGGLNNKDAKSVTIEESESADANSELASHPSSSNSNMSNDDAFAQGKAHEAVGTSANKNTEMNVHGINKNGITLNAKKEVVLGVEGKKEEESNAAEGIKIDHGKTADKGTGNAGVGEKLDGIDVIAVKKEVNVKIDTAAVKEPVKEKGGVKGRIAAKEGADVKHGIVADKESNAGIGAIGSIQSNESGAGNGKHGNADKGTLKSVGAFGFGMNTEGTSEKGKHDEMKSEFGVGAGFKKQIKK